MNKYEHLLPNVLKRFDFNDRTTKYHLNGDLTEEEYCALMEAINAYQIAQNRERREK